MKPTLLTCIICVLVNYSYGQRLGYYLPEKRLKITVTYTVRAYFSKGLPAQGDGRGLEPKYEVFIKDDISVEEIVVPDTKRYFEIIVPDGAAKGASRFDWNLKVNEKGILSGLNASREPAATAILIGATGFITNIITGIAGTKTAGIDIPRADTQYDKITEQEVTATEMIDIPAEGIRNRRVAIPALKAEITDSVMAFPSVTISIYGAQEDSIGNTERAQNNANVLHYVVPKYYRLTVDVYHNGFLDEARVIDNLISVPQHGVLQTIPMSGLFRGKKTIGVSIHPDTGQLVSFQYKKEGNVKSGFVDLNRQLKELSDAFIELKAADGRHLEKEIDQLELEVRKLELMEKKRSLLSESL
jgi:hypothetical protein